MGLFGINWEELKMALIQCPSCGKPISDKAKKCVHCGYILQEPQRLCPECGAELEKGATICSKCGCPIENNSSKEAQPQKVEVTKVNIVNYKVQKKKIVIIFAVVLVAICAFFGAIKILNQKKVQAYGDELKKVSTLMLDGAVDAEDCGNLIKSVWSNSIFEEKDSTTDKYTRSSDGTGYFYDFNTALSNLFDDAEFQAQIDDIENNQESVADMMKNMKNPPEEWEDAYDDLQEYYDAYLTLTNMAVNPTGSLQTYSSSFSEADMEVANNYDRMKSYFE